MGQTRHDAERLRGRTRAFLTGQASAMLAIVVLLAVWTLLAVAP